MIVEILGEGSAPHSLGKLIEWKRSISVGELTMTDTTPHSLGKLIEWKLAFHISVSIFVGSPAAVSPLAGETN